jgi:hypothetical protein
MDAPYEESVRIPLTARGPAYVTGEREIYDLRVLVAQRGSIRSRVGSRIVGALFGASTNQTITYRIQIARPPRPETLDTPKSDRCRTTAAACSKVNERLDCRPSVSAGMRADRSLMSSSVRRGDET